MHRLVRQAVGQFLVGAEDFLGLYERLLVQVPVMPLTSISRTGGPGKDFRLDLGRRRLGFLDLDNALQRLWTANVSGNGLSFVVGFARIVVENDACQSQGCSVRRWSRACRRSEPVQRKIQQVARC